MKLLEALILRASPPNLYSNLEFTSSFSRTAFFSSILTTLIHFEYRFGLEIEIRIN